ncbi:hypothetical protein [Halorubrum sp. LN27]|uniref:hypothetical protein n=1 Tax=Halorubrum sp. LN27 TaxID=2801032 RepID=UPI00190D85A0|nr:hypothetical protein [Halorubrum sp. LN27]
MQGLKVAKTMMALVLAIGILSGLGFSQIAGVDLGTSGLDVSDAESVSDEVSQSEVEDFGGEDASNFGITTGATGAVTALWLFVTKTGPILSSWGIPGVIATSAHVMAVLAFGLSILAILRGLASL